MDMRYFYREPCSGLVFLNNSSFSYADLQTGSPPCSNPGVSSSNPATCADPYIVGTNEPDPGECGGIGG